MSTHSVLAPNMTLSLSPHAQSGYVEGVEAGKGEGLKEGFSSGFASGLAAATPWAILKGQAEYVILVHPHPSTCACVHVWGRGQG